VVPLPRFFSWHDKNVLFNVQVLASPRSAWPAGPRVIASLSSGPCLLWNYWWLPHLWLGLSVVWFSSHFSFVCFQAHKLSPEKRILFFFWFFFRFFFDVFAWRRKKGTLEAKRNEHSDSSQEEGRGERFTNIKVLPWPEKHGDNKYLKRDIEGARTKQKKKKKKKKK